MRSPARLRCVFLTAGLVLSTAAGCAHPHRGPKMLAGVGAALAGVGAGVWILGDNRGSEGVAATGLATTALGVATMIGAGIWMAQSVSCRADADCPRGEECREVPAIPGGVPYAQCVPR